MPSAVCFTAPAAFLAGGLTDAPFEDAAFVTDSAFPEDAAFFPPPCETVVGAVVASGFARLFAGVFAGACTAAGALVRDAGDAAVPDFPALAAFPAAAAFPRAGAERAGRSGATPGAAFPRSAEAPTGVAFFAVAFFVAVVFFPTMVAAPSHIVILLANRAGTINRLRTRGNGARRRIRPPCPAGRQVCIRCAQLSARYSGTNR
ncbi:hypothetical protein ACIP98_09535 [Streptomyces sp. NPDC088354]|uniref:hypothetical protein n=1 Tax=Streptomyces sp. NPDC088354 TaxID=3365856 RepID=UPI00381FF203